MMNDKDLLNKYPSLEVLYEHIKDTLPHESQALSDLSGKSTFLWGAITAILGIAIPVGWALGKPAAQSSLLAWILGMYGLTTIASWLIMFPKSWHDIVDFETLWEEYSEESKERFWLDMFSHIKEASDKNQRRLLWEAWLVRFISVITLAELLLLFRWVNVS